MVVGRNSEAIDLKSKTSRKTLTPRREPYWQRISAGFFVGYRVIESGSGTWIARLRGDDKKQKYYALGTFEKYDDAAEAARSWREGMDRGVVKAKETVTDICKSYVEDLKTRKGKGPGKDAEGRFRRLVYNANIGNIRLDKLTPPVVRNWLNEQVAEPDDDEHEDEAEIIRRSKDSANRNLRALKAALNKALADGLVASDFAWKKVLQFENASRKREVVFSMKARSDLLKRCSVKFEPFIRSLLLTGARPGELAVAKVSDFDPEQGTIGLTGKTGRRVVTLSTVATEFFRQQCEEKSSRSNIFANEWGAPWNKDSWKKEFRESADAAKIPPDFVVYSLRHTAISEMLVAKLSIGVVALLAGTSPEMIGKHYAHILHPQTRETLDSATLI